MVFCFGMMVHQHRPGEHAERVCIHKCAFATARMISFGAKGCPNAMLYLALKDSITLMKYGSSAAHHALIFRPALSSQVTSAALPEMIASMVSAQWRLYGTSMSGSSWWIFLQSWQRNRLIISVLLSPSASITIRGFDPIVNSRPPQIGQTLVSSAHMKCYCSFCLCM